MVQLMTSLFHCRLLTIKILLSLLFKFLHFSGSSELFATCGSGSIRVWHTNSNQELLRIQVPNKTCTSIAFSRDGKSIVSGMYSVYLK